MKGQRASEGYVSTWRTCARCSDKSRIEEAGQGEDCVRELRTDVMLAGVHEGLRGRDDAHAVVAPQDVHQIAVPKGGPHLCMHMPDHRRKVHLFTIQQFSFHDVRYAVYVCVPEQSMRPKQAYMMLGDKGIFC